ncbi:MAG: hypothetical protein QF441_09710 [Bacteriovoracaceae bacterium]|nr:hypothetical protein [Bacteriovoracaceae bacterium]
MIRPKSKFLFTKMKSDSLIDVLVKGVVYGLGIYIGRKVKSRIKANS